MIVFLCVDCINSLGANKAIVIDGIVPTVTSVNVPANATYPYNENLNFTVNFRFVFCILEKFIY